MQITVQLLRRFAGRGAKAAILQAIADHAADVLPRYGINSPIRLQHFFAQVAHECGGFTIREENLNYTTTARLRIVWPSRFRSDEAARPFVRNALLLGSTVYANRMGNGAPSTGDGYKFRGRSLAQHTGKDGYRAIATITGLPLVEQPDLVNDARHMLECAAAFWQWKNLRPAADRDDIVTVTKKWNGGQIGLAERRAWLAKARKIFTEPLDALIAPFASVATAEEPAPAPVAPHGAKSAEIETVQRRLDAMGYFPGALKGEWGGMTAGAIAGFKNDRKLEGAPVIDAALLADLDAAEAENWKRPIAAARANTTAADLAPTVPAVRETWRTRMMAKVGTIGTGIAALGGILRDTFDDVREKLEPVADIVGSVPWWVYAGLAIGIGGFIWISSRKTEQNVIDLKREGRLT